MVKVGIVGYGYWGKNLVRNFNALDNLYVQDSVDHSQYNSYGDKVHAAHNAEVFLGIPRYFNAGLVLRF